MNELYLHIVKWVPSHWVGGNIKNFAWVPKIVWAPCFNVSLSFKSWEKKTSINQGKIYEKNILKFINPINKLLESLLKI